MAPNFINSGKLVEGMQGAFPRQGMLMGQNLLPELAYSLVVVVVCLIIYYKINELYQLSSHKGLKYFRNTFGYFSLAYGVKLASRFIILTTQVRGRGYFLPFFEIITVYASLLAVMYLIYSMIWRNLEGTKFEEEHTLHLMAFFLSAVAVSARHPIVYLIAQVLIVSYGIWVWFSHNKKPGGKKTKINALYPPLLLFFVLNIVDLFVPSFLIFAQHLIYIASSLLFVLILYKLLRIGSKK